MTGETEKENAFEDTGAKTSSEATFGGHTGEPVSKMGGVEEQVDEASRNVDQNFGSEAQLESTSPVNSEALKGLANALNNVNDVFREGSGEAQAIHEQIHTIGGPSQDSLAETGTYEISIDDAKLLLQQARDSLNASGTDSELRDVINHPGAADMLDTLKANNIDPITVQGQQGLSPEEQIQSVLEAGHDATIENGLDMPTVTPEVEIPSTEVMPEYGAADDEYDYGLG